MIAAAQYLVERGYVDSASTLSVGLDECVAAVRSTAGLAKAARREVGPRRDEGRRVVSVLGRCRQRRGSRGTTTLRTTPEYARKKKAWKFDAQKPAGGRRARSVRRRRRTWRRRPSTLNLFDDRDELRLTLVVPVAPHETNGDFEAADKKQPGGTISWHQAPARPPRVADGLLRVVERRRTNDIRRPTSARRCSKDDELAKFVGYFGQLPKPQQDEFAAHLKSLEPGDALRGRVRDFRFTTTTDDELRHIAEQMLDVLYESL